MDFSSCWKRIESETDIKNLSQLSKFLDTTSSNVTKKKQKGKFPIEWAYIIGQKYGILTEWIMTGKGKKRINDTQLVKNNVEFLNYVDKWLSELIIKQPDRLSWFIMQFEDSFPLFNEWKKGKEFSTDSRRENGESKVA